MSSAGKVGAALKISEADQATIAGLRRETEKAWKVVKDSQDKARRRTPWYLPGHHAMGSKAWTPARKLHPKQQKHTPCCMCTGLV